MKHVDALSWLQNVLVLEGNTLEQTLALNQSCGAEIAHLKKLLENEEHSFCNLRN